MSPRPTWRKGRSKHGTAFFRGRRRKKFDGITELFKRVLSLCSRARKSVALPLYGGGYAVKRSVLSVRRLRVTLGHERFRAGTRARVPCARDKTILDQGKFGHPVYFGRGEYFLS